MQVLIGWLNERLLLYDSQYETQSLDEVGRLGSTEHELPN